MLPSKEFASDSANIWKTPTVKLAKPMKLQIDFLNIFFDRASLYNLLQMKPTRCTLLLSILISTSLHVLGNCVSIITRTCTEVEINILRSSVHLVGFIWKRLYIGCSCLELSAYIYIYIYILTTSACEARDGYILVEIYRLSRNTVKF